MKQIFILFFFLFSKLIAQNNLPKIGSVAPELQISDWIGKKVSGVNTLQNKTIILDFWATWCVPCIETIPHLNKLTEKFSSDSVIFISMTDENVSDVIKFLKKREMKSFIVRDDKRKTYDSFNVVFIPVTFIIDSKRIIKWIGHPKDLSIDIINKILSKDTVYTQTQYLGQYHVSMNKISVVRKTYYYFEVAQSTDVSDASSHNISITDSLINIHFGNQTIKNIISTLIDLKYDESNNNDSMITRKFDITLSTVERKSLKKLKERLAQKLCELFELKLMRQYKLTKCWVLKIKNIKVLSSHLSSHTSKDDLSHMSSNDSTWVGSKVLLKILAKELSDLFNKRIIYDKSTKEKYDIQLKFSNFDEAKENLEREFGLSLVRAKRQQEYISLVKRRE